MPKKPLWKLWHFLVPDTLHWGVPKKMKCLGFERLFGNTCGMMWKEGKSRWWGLRLCLGLSQCQKLPKIGKNGQKRFEELTKKQDFTWIWCEVRWLGRPWSLMGIKIVWVVTIAQKLPKKWLLTPNPRFFNIEPPVLVHPSDSECLRLPIYMFTAIQNYAFLRLGQKTLIFSISELATSFFQSMTPYFDDTNG